MIHDAYRQPESGNAQRDEVRVAGIDVGSNTVRLQIADVRRSDAGHMTAVPVHTASFITRLAQDVDTSGRLHPEAMSRVRSALVECKQLMRTHSAVFGLLTATSAVRDSDNGEAFLGEIEYGFGFRTRLLSGAEEAELALAGLSSSPEMQAIIDSGTTLTIDIGGGSTELALLDSGTLLDAHSFQLGSVRGTERWLGDSDPPSQQALTRWRADVRNQITHRFPDRPSITTAIGVAGTVTTVAAIQLEMSEWNASRVHGMRLTLDQIESVSSQLRGLPLSQRAQVVGLEPKRAPVIVAGLVLLTEILDVFGCRDLVVSTSDILDGIVQQAGAIALDEGIEELAEPFGKTVC